MRRAYGRLVLFLTMLLSVVPMFGCRPTVASASIEGPRLTLSMGVGDSLKLRSAWHVVGAVDSVIVTYSSTRFASIRKAWPGAGSHTADSSIAIPAPPLNAGDVVTVTANFSFRIGNTIESIGNLSAGYSQPGVIPDSLRVTGLIMSPADTTIAIGQTVQFCTVATYADGHKEAAAGSGGVVPAVCIARFGSASQRSRALLLRSMFGRES